VSEENHLPSGVEQPRSKTVVCPTSQTARFPDLRSAGRDLAIALERFSAREDVIVLGLVLGGVLGAHEVAAHLGVQLDFIIIRRLVTPRGPGSQACAVNVAGSLVIDEELMPRPAVPVSAFDYFVSDALDVLSDRERTCRGGRPAVDLAQKTIILVDCGIRTGLTMRAAVGALRRKGPASIVAAVPVASKEGRAAIERVADDVICLGSREPFGHVGIWYDDFNRPGDNQVSEFLR
jgi:putative phosphoribosyl transferase